MHLGSWVKENGLNLHWPSLCNKCHSLQPVCWHNLWIALNHPVTAWLGTYLWCGYPTACRQCWCMPVSWCQMKICHCLTVKINSLKYYTKPIKVLIYSIYKLHLHYISIVITKHTHTKWDPLVLVPVTVDEAFALMGWYLAYIGN